MRIALLDDDHQETEDFLSVLKQWDSSRTAECFFDGEKFLNAAKRLPHFTVAFLDIYLPNENGIDIAKKLHGISPETEIVFTTTSQDHAVEAFSMNAVHYIIKPVKLENITEVFSRISGKRKVRTTISLKVENSIKLLYTDEILSAQSNDHEMNILLGDGSEFCANIKCSDLLSMLGDDFMLIQRGYIVNADFIERMSADSCILKDGKTLLLSRKDKSSIHTQYNNYVFRRLSDGLNFYPKS